MGGTLLRLGSAPRVQAGTGAAYGVAAILSVPALLFELFIAVASVCCGNSPSITGTRSRGALSSAQFNCSITVRHGLFLATFNRVSRHPARRS